MSFLLIIAISEHILIFISDIHIFLVIMIEYFGMSDLRQYSSNHIDSSQSFLILIKTYLLFDS